ncbi:hypothetical protein C1H46_014042 [Malus baccata]|uniref:Uncharacterized protein n=1 Tax=Malus baccata TaxID=106549 RepID=A0A540MNH8_MALBA|nr:hypothetical protein C1H46_014042 [Malus baccata]
MVIPLRCFKFGYVQGSAISLRTINLANILILTGGKQLQEVEMRDWTVVDT